MIELLEELARVNYSGAPFLVAYGITWLICGVLWRKIKLNYAAIATLFQGMVALPIALLILYIVGAFTLRPDTGILNSLSIIIAMSQLLAIPLLIAMFQREHYTIIPFIFSIVGAVHFLMYAWLYQEVAYIIMPIVLSVLLAVIYGKSKDNQLIISAKSAALACYATGGLLLINALYLLSGYII